MEHQLLAIVCVPVIHTDAKQYEICDYCLKHKRWMYPRTIYYKHGFAKKDVLMCDDCHKIERRFYESRFTTHVTEHKAYEAICLTIKEKTSASSNCFLLHKNDNRSIDDKETCNRIVGIDYYDAVRIAYQNSIARLSYFDSMT